MTREEVAERLAARFGSRFLQGYVRWKVRTDPVYGAVLERLRGHEHPLIDVGCGIGIFPLFLREHGFAMPIVGIDHDAEKIAAAQRAGGAEYRVGDAREPLPRGHSVLLLDLLHYFTGDVQARILRNAAEAVPPGGVVIIRAALRDGSWRYRVTMLQESFARVIRWLKAERLHFPTRETIFAPFDGFESEAVPLWGKTPFNNYLFVFRKVSS